MTLPRHMFVVAGISRDAVMEKAVKASHMDTEPVYVHDHYWAPNMGERLCTDKCLVISSGNVETVVPITRTDDAQAAPSA